MCLNITIVCKIQSSQYVAITFKQISHEFYTMFNPYFCKKNDLPPTFTLSLYHI